MPTKYGLPLVEIFQALDLNLRPLSLAQRQNLLETHNLTFYYTPQHFPQTRILTDYRDQIGKRPPLATLDMIWSPYAGPARLIIGYVHPATETIIREALAARGQEDFTLVKGLEGSCDLRLSLTNIISTPDPDCERGMRYLKLNPQDYGLAGKEVALISPEHYFQELKALLNNDPSELRRAMLWNGGFYLWHCGICPDLKEGIQRTEALLENGKIRRQWQALKEAIA
jgi:anthranilate phosphoribosyltransferase